MKYMTNEIWYLYDRFIDRMNDPDIISYRNNYSVYDYVKEFRTLEIKLPRGVGKTYFISTMSRNNNIIVVVPKNYMRIEYERFGIKSFIVTSDNSFRGSRIENLFLDEVPICDLFKHQPHINSNFTYDTTIVSLYT